MYQRIYYATLLSLALGLMAAGLAPGAEPARPSRKLPALPGKAPVFAIVTTVNESAGTFNFFLLYDEVINTERLVQDASGKTIRKSSESVMTNRFEEKTDRPLKGSIVSTGEGLIIPMNQAQKELAGKIVIMCDDFEGLHPVFRKMLTKDTWIIEIEKPGGLRKSGE